MPGVVAEDDFSRWEETHERRLLSVHGVPAYGGSLNYTTAADGLRGRIAEIVYAFEDADDDFHEAWDAAAGDEEREWRAACALNAARGVCIDALAALLSPADAPAERTLTDAPPHLGHSEASAWADGYNAALAGYGWERGRWVLAKEILDVLNSGAAPEERTPAQQETPA